jgi:DMSO/TMAO reductase YedYZ heme-binding membrane subunit
VPLSILHYFWLERDIKDWVLVYAVLVGLLFVIRLPAIRQLMGRGKPLPPRIASESSPEADT